MSDFIDALDANVQRIPQVLAGCTIVSLLAMAGMVYGGFLIAQAFR